MGADLYIGSLHEKAVEKYQPLIDKAVGKRDKATTDKEKERWQKEVDRLWEEQNQDSYFRDSYNDSSLLWQIGLSWWGDITPLLNEERYLPLAKVKWFLEKVKVWEVPAPKDLKFKGPFPAGDDRPSDQELKDWHEYFVKKKRRLEEFLIRCLELEESPSCSL